MRVTRFGPPCCSSRSGSRAVARAPLHPAERRRVTGGSQATRRHGDCERHGHPAAVRRRRCPRAPPSPWPPCWRPHQHLRRRPQPVPGHGHRHRGGGRRHAAPGYLNPASMVVPAVEERAVVRSPPVRPNADKPGPAATRTVMRAREHWALSVASATTRRLAGSTPARLPGRAAPAPFPSRATPTARRRSCGPSSSNQRGWSTAAASTS